MERRIDFTKFRQILQSLENSDIGIRLRMSGEGWMDFAKLILLSESAMIVQDDSGRKVIMNLRNVVQFEIDEPLLDLSAHTQYEVVILFSGSWQ
jgi:hypothetical protein